MARTPLADQLQRTVSRLAAEDAATRREFLLGAGAAGAGLAMAGTLGRVADAVAASPPRIVVVGAGLAGLTCAYRLRQAGLNAQVHEASDRVGGRCWTLRGAFADGQIAEHGGELIDQGHTETRQLAQELGLSLDNLLAAQPNGTEDAFWFDGGRYSVADATRDLKGIWQTIHRDVSDAGYPTTYQSSTARGRALDNMSAAAWIDASVPGGRSSKLGQLLDVAYNIEYGAETTDQSSLNLLYLLGFSGQGNLHIFGPSNEKYHVVGGNDQIPARLAAALPGQVTLGSVLTAIARNADGTFGLTLRQGSKTVKVTADHVVLALPFSLLRASVDYSRAGFSPVKRTAIAKLGMGTNSKLHVQFSSRHWYTLGNNGNTYADTGYQDTWEVTRAQPGTSGILVDYTGGTTGRRFGSDTPAALAQRFLAQIEPVLPGLGARWNGRAAVDSWPDYPWTRGSYSYWKVGQYQRFAGAEGQREGNCHFAGEHTSIDNQGYLNGAVETGERAATEILSDLK
jgi:monoamine oxidase